LHLGHFQRYMQGRASRFAYFRFICFLIGLGVLAVKVFDLTTLP
jgi:hypothetical protein